MRARSEEEISKLSVRVQHLQKLYESQELIISKNKNQFLYLNVQCIYQLYIIYKLHLEYIIKMIKIHFPTRSEQQKFKILPSPHFKFKIKLADIYVYKINLV